MKPCGTNGGYSRHYYNRDDICDSCRNAHKAYMKAWHRGVRVSTSSVIIADYLETHGPLEVNALVDHIQVRHLGIKDATIRRAVWRMVKDGRLIVEYDPIFPLTVEVP
jgi:hypothetical protein